VNIIGLWQIGSEGPARLASTRVALERDLEAWIEQDPSVLEAGLVVVGRQVRLEGGPLDLLALDPQGRWVLIEIKRDQLRREVLMQAVDYASCLHRLDSQSLHMSCDQYLKARGSTTTLRELLTERGRSQDLTTDDREIVIYVVGTGVDQHLERMVKFLEERADLVIRIVTLAPFEDHTGRLFLARTIHERVTEVTTPDITRAKPGGPSVEEVLAMADSNGVGAAVRGLHAAATDAGFVARPYAKSLMFAPPANRTRCLFVVWIDRREREPGVVRGYLAAEAFEQFYGIPITDTEAALGAAGYQLFNAAYAKTFGENLRQLMENAATR